MDGQFCRRTQLEQHGDDDDDDDDGDGDKGVKAEVPRNGHNAQRIRLEWV